MFCTYLPQSVKLQPETATEPASAFSAGLCSKKHSFSEQQDAENRLYKESGPPPGAEETPPADWPPSPQRHLLTCDFTGTVWIRDACTVRNGNQSGEAEFLVSGSPDKLEFAQTQTRVTRMPCKRGCELWSGSIKSQAYRNIQMIHWWKLTLQFTHLDFENVYIYKWDKNYIFVNLTQ